ncbi:Oidioi.mRNA.OKI2018_I69.XSR.g17001.t1.cds [Oikopleura dioica]|uniref:Oidioi.mRNA.OKI2018_I69.XSR.g17001.t1.cds n=1 Tax=Oikopleura dioica TaxID=34765 RepID=A0ABN7SLQ2_OIKDI|nr:Oidioi.mRNA.OKI2018_I69.XSR.g17001.t1.cds [Oikopleura dioica]
MSFISNVFISSSLNGPHPPNSQIVSRTKEGNEADLYPRGGFFGLKNTKRYLVVEKNKTASEVVTDLCIIADDQNVPSGFTEIKRTLEKDDKCLHSTRLCVAKGSFHTSAKKVTDIAITSDDDFARNHLYTSAGKLNGLYLCFKVEVSNRLSEAKRASAAEKKRVAPPPPAAASPVSRSSRSPIASPLDGVQFSLHECVSNGVESAPKRALPKSTVPIQNQDEIISKYFYGFEIEEKALRRIH